MKTADMQTTNLYGDLNMTFQQSIDMARRDAADRVTQGAVPKRKFGSWGFWFFKTLAAMILALFLLDMFAAGGWDLEQSPAMLRDLIVVIVSAAALVGLDACQRRLRRRTQQ